MNTENTRSNTKNTRSLSNQALTNKVFAWSKSPERKQRVALAHIVCASRRSSASASPACFMFACGSHVSIASLAYSSGDSVLYFFMT